MDFLCKGHALACVAQWIECGPVNQKVSGLIPSRGTCLGCELGSQFGVYMRQPIDVSLHVATVQGQTGSLRTWADERKCTELWGCLTHLYSKVGNPRMLQTLCAPSRKPLIPLHTNCTQNWQGASVLYNTAWFCAHELIQCYGNRLSDPVSRLWEHCFSWFPRHLGEGARLTLFTPQSHTLMFLSLSFSLPSPLPKNKQNLKKKVMKALAVRCNNLRWCLSFPLREIIMRSSHQMGSHKLIGQIWQSQQQTVSNILKIFNNRLRIYC